tara:strand:- start:16 stop:684 length:669 start_codon:yes stop_codon:yes gene_type:complete
VKTTLIVALSMGLIHPQSEKFNVINGNPSEIIQSTSFWLSGSPIINPMTNNRMILQISSSSLFRIDNSDIYRYPNIDIGLKVTKNLALTYKSYGFRSGDENPHVLGGGLQYYFGNKDTLDWSSTFQRVDIKGLKYFSLTSLLVDIRKWYDWKNFKFRLGVGSNFFKQRFFSSSNISPETMKGQVNFIGFDLSIPIWTIILGLENRISTQIMSSTIYIHKEIF